MTWVLWRSVELALVDDPKFVLFTDADICHPPNLFCTLVSAAVTNDLDMVSQIAMLRVSRFWDRLLIPAFVLFFSMVYPFRWSNDPRSGVATAAGGCLLVGTEALLHSGGIEAIAGNVIDDCALARQVRRYGRPGGGRLGLGLSSSVRSVRPYDGLRDIWTMVARSAYAQLRYSPWRLVGTIIGLTFMFMVPPVAVGLAWAGYAFDLPALLPLGLLGSGAFMWILMAVSHMPISRWYGTPIVMTLALPFTAGIYTLTTIGSARRYWSGGGARWCGGRVL